MKSKGYKKSKQFWYLQNWGTYSNQTFVCIGMNHQEITDAFKKLKSKPAVINAWIRDKEKLLPQLTMSDGGLTWRDEESCVTLLWFPTWKNDWQHWDSLLHETYHLVYFGLLEQRLMNKEEDAFAYQQEYLFREIRRTLWKIFP